MKTGNGKPEQSMSSKTLDRRGDNSGFADGVLLAKLGSPPKLAWLFVVFAFAKLFVQTASFEQLFETAKGGTDGFFVVNAHP
jgi:hypothetical protein